jgi:hypothetical protein
LFSRAIPDAEVLAMLPAVPSAPDAHASQRSPR